MQTGQGNHTDTSETLFLNLQKIFRCLSFGRSMQAKAPTLSVTQMRILSFFNEQEVVYISEISRVLGMSLQSVNNLVHRLELRGYVERSKNQSDKRLSDIRLTPKGRMGFQAFRNEQFEVLGELLAGIEDTEQKLLTATVEATAIILEKAAMKNDTDRA